MSNSKFSTMPEQKVQAFKPLSRAASQLFIDYDPEAKEDADTEVESPKKRSKQTLEILQGGQSEEDYSRPNPVYQNFYGHGNALASPPKTFLERAKLMPLNQSTGDIFFADPMVKTLGIVTQCQMRLGFDPLNKVWKIYFRKTNYNKNPSTLGILFAEVDEIIDFLNDALAKIESGLAKDEPPFAVKAGDTNLKPDNADFWSKAQFYTQSAAFRIRILHKCANVYQFYLNVVNDNSSFEGYYGPRACLGRPEVVQFVDAILAIKKECPDIKEMY